jgi:chromosome segregation and condensation protein ScpB
VTYGTTARFLELFKLQSLDDLPQTQELQKL